LSFKGKIMATQPSIIVSSVDFERLDQLLSSKLYNRLPGVEALENELGRASVVEPADVPPEVVSMNSLVRFIEDKSGAESQLTLVYPHEAGPADTVSILAPVGGALLGLSVGQSILWQVPGGREISLRVLAVVRQPEALGALQH
jgi:regulator of nucleoside diphosphate kinase